MRVLVLGGNGFIGSHLVRKLLSIGAEVSILDRGACRLENVSSSVRYFQGGMADSALVSEAIRGCDVVCHLVSTTVPSTSNQDPVADIEGNLIPTVRLLELMRRQGVAKIVYLSSGGTVYGEPQQELVPETHALNPLCSYGVIKGAIENYLGMYHSLYGIQASVLRASNPYGPNQSHSGVQGLIGTCLRRVKDGHPIEIWGDGGAVRDYIFIDDLVGLVCAAIESEATGTFNAGSGEGRSVNQVLEAIGRATGRQPHVEYHPSRRFDVGRIVLDVTKAREAFHWKPTIELDEGLKRTWDWVLAHSAAT